MESIPGEIITFYSYKGGTGRSMALANVACLLAQKRNLEGGVLMIDWDLEAPGLHQFFRGRLENAASKPGDLPPEQPGLIDLFYEFRDRLKQHESEADNLNLDEILDAINIDRYIVRTGLPFLFLMPAGTFGDGMYSARVNEFDWAHFFDKFPSAITLFAQFLRKRFRYVLIDSRTGYTDISGICTSIMPEKLVTVFTPNRQSLLGVVELIRRATSYRKQSDDLRPLMIFPLPSRIENAESELQNDWRFGNTDRGVDGYQSQIETALMEVYGLTKCDLTTYFDEYQLQYITRYSYGEEIAVLSERSDVRLSLARSFEDFTDIIVSNETPWDAKSHQLYKTRKSEYIEKHVFVLMPFREEFEDVYDVIKSACNDRMLGFNVVCLRADEIEKPGAITDQIIEHIRHADVIVADLTGDNPNVMYELGYARGLRKPTIIINQSVKGSPFDVAGMRQIVYDRNRLARDCRPRLVTSLNEILGSVPTVEISDMPQESVDVKRGQPAVMSHPLIVSDRLIAQTQSLHVKMELANSTGNLEGIRQLANEFLNILDRISVTDVPATIDLRNFVGMVGNCAIELEKAELSREAEDIWKRAIALMPMHGSVHFQYGEFLIDRGRVAEATIEAQRARELSPTDPRIQRLEMKIALALGEVDDEIGEKMRQSFEKDPSDSQAATSYLMFLARSEAPLELFENVCMEWQNALPADKKHIATRALADHLVESEQYGRAKDLYETFLSNLSGKERVHVLHNIAIAYDKLNMQESAEASWREAYNLNPSNSMIQTAFSQWLANWDKLDVAVKVASGLPIT